MAKQATDLYTVDLLSGRGRGRPRKPDALTAAERAKRYRAKRARTVRTVRSVAPSKMAMFHGPNGETWTGRGQKPKWIISCLAAGLIPALW